MKTQPILSALWALYPPGGCRRPCRHLTAPGTARSTLVDGETIKRRLGFTMVEIMVTAAISSSVLIAILSVYISCIQSWHRTTLSIGVTREASHCLDQMVYGVGTGQGLRASYAITNLGSATNWVLLSSNYSGVAWYNYNPTQTTVTYSNATKSLIIGTNIIASTATATVNTVNIALTVRKFDGRYSESNTVRTFVKIRAPMTK